MERREFLINGSAIACACLLCSCAAEPAKEAGRPAAPVDLGPLSDLPAEEVNGRWAEAEGFFLIRRDRSLYAVGAYCTHKRVLLSLHDRKLRCARHGSVFETTGEASKGPAKTPLPRFAIRRDGRGHVVVDSSTKFGKEQWSDPQASVALDA